MHIPQHLRQQKATAIKNAAKNKIINGKKFMCFLSTQFVHSIFKAGRQESLSCVML